MRKLPILVAVLAAIGFGACAEGAEPPKGGLFGTVLRGPTMPVCRVDEPCEAPAAGVVLSFSRSGKVVRARTDRRGRYRVRLAPGTYAITTDQVPFGVKPMPATARVAKDRFARVDLRIDTGIR